MIWQACNGLLQIEPIDGELFRLVESQEQIATLGYVDTLEEQAMLEQMLDKLKPAYPSRCDDLHYLLKTPFRYPPLPWGSRFGRVHEKGIFYAAESVDVTLAESAYYRFVFWSSMDAKAIKDNIRTEHSLFSAHYKTAKGIRLQSAAFSQYQHELTDVRGYCACQELGSSMREAGVEVFEYESARDSSKGVCVGLFAPAAFVDKNPQNIDSWLCETSAREIAFKQLSSRTVRTFPIEMFLSDGVLPLPA